MSFLSSLQQVVADVTNSVSNLGISPTRMFNRENSEPETQVPPPLTGNRSKLGPRLVPNPAASLSATVPSRFRSGSTSAQGSKQVATIVKPPNYQQLQSVSPRRDTEAQPLPQLQCGDRYTYWPEYDPAQNWVGEKDGGWLEQFTSLGWQHSQTIRSLKTTAARQGSRDVLPDVLASFKSQELQVSKDELESLFIEVIYTIKHKVGANKDAQHMENLTRYAQSAFPLESSAHARLLQAVREEKSPILVLNLIVVEAEGLEAKDPNGYSDPYCMMGIVAQDKDSTDESTFFSKPYSETVTTTQAFSSKPFEICGKTTQIQPLERTTSGSSTVSTPNVTPKRGENIVTSIAMSGALLMGTGTMRKLGSGERSSSPVPGHTRLEGRDSSDHQSDQSSGSFSDPYCMLGIQPAVTVMPPPSPREPPNSSPPGIDSPKLRTQWSRGSQDTENDASDGSDSPRSVSKESLRKHHSFRISFKRRGGSSDSQRTHRDSLTNIIPAKIIRATSVKSHTLNPRWGEKFRLDIDDITTDILHLDIWDHDDETSVLDVVSKLNEVKGVKGLGRFFKQIAQSARSGGEDDFLGCVNIPLADLPSTRVDRWYKLEARSLRSNIQGQIHLRMWLSTREDRGTSEEEVWKEVQQHEQIIKVFILHELQKWKDDSLGWEGSLSSQAETILHQHAIQGDLTRLQLAVCRWMAYSYVHRSRPLDHRILLKLLTSLHDLWDDENLSTEEEEMLGASFNDFLTHSLTEMKRHKDLFPTPSKTNALRCDALLKCLAILAESQTYWKLNPTHKDIRTEVFTALKKSGHLWFIYRSNKSGLNSQQQTKVPTTSSQTTNNVVSRTQSLLPNMASSSSTATTRGTLGSTGSHDSAQYTTTSISVPTSTMSNEGFSSGSGVTSVPVSPLPGTMVPNNLASCAPEENIEKLARMVLQFSLDLQNGIDYYEYTFDKSLRIPYVNTLYRIWEKQLTEYTMRILTDYQRNKNYEEMEAAVWNQCAILTETELSKEPPPLNITCSTAPFILYLALTEFSKFQEHLTGSGESTRPTTGLTLGCVWRQFSPNVSDWLDHACYVVLMRIRRAILSDRVANTGETVQYTTSAVDATSCFYHVKTFWRHLCWPDASSAYNLILKIIQLTSLAAEYYISLLQQRLVSLPLNATDEQKALQLCITVNNMEHVRHSYTLLEEELQIQDLTKSLELEDPQNGRAWGDHLSALIQSGIAALDARIEESMLPIADKMRQDLQKDVFHLAWSPDSLPAREAVRPLLEYLRNALTVYSASLLKNNLDRLLHLLWQAVLMALSHQITKDSQENEEDGSQEKLNMFFLRLYDALNLLQEFFHAGGRGLDAEVLRCPEFVMVETQLRLHKTTTDELLERYYIERLMIQERYDSHQFGSIFVRVYFNHDSLCVEILQARNVIPLDPNGLSDPFVVVELVPRRLFPSCVPQSTNVHKRTLNPLFDECFEFPATLESCQAEGAMIVFTLMDHDVITCNDFGGEAFLSLNTIPGVASASSGVDNLHGLKPIELSLMFRNDPDNMILQVLETRNKDKTAMEFVKKQKTRLISKMS